MRDGMATQAQIDTYHEKGYTILERIVPDDVLAMLREECHYFVGYQDGAMDARGDRSSGITHRGQRYFIANQYRMSHRIWRFIYSDLMARVVTTALGEEVYLFNEQWVVKGPEVGMEFAWHQDAGYVKHADPATTVEPYLTCWCALDDMTEANGTVYVLPHDRAGTRDKVLLHEKDPRTHDLIGYTGDDPGEAAIVPAGSIVAFSSYLFHRSGANTSDAMRRVYLLQYSAAPVRRSDGSLWAMAVPFLNRGKIVYDHEADTAERYGP